MMKDNNLENEVNDKIKCLVNEEMAMVEIIKANESGNDNDKLITRMLQLSNVGEQRAAIEELNRAVSDNDDISKSNAKKMIMEFELDLRTFKKIGTDMDVEHLMGPDFDKKRLTEQFFEYRLDNLYRSFANAVIRSKKK